MRLLLDTQILVWTVAASERLEPEVHALLEDIHNEVFFSAVSILEISIKSALKRADFKFRPETITAAAHHTGYLEMPLTAAMAAGVATLPRLHNDPFDRALVAQAMAGAMILLTTDAALVPYSGLVTLVRRA